MRLVTEAEGRQGLAGEVAEAREAWLGGLIFLSLWTLAGVGLLAWPWWSEPFPDLAAKAADMPLIWVGGFLLLLGLFFYGTVRAAMRPSAWLVRASRDGLRLKFRSYLHWRWPAEDRVVLVISRHEVDRLVPLRKVITVSNGKNLHREPNEQLYLVLRAPLEDEVVRALALEQQKRVGGGRYLHTPLLVSTDGTTLCLMWRGQGSNLQPPLKTFLPRLQSWYRVEPMVQSFDFQAYRLEDQPLSADETAELHQLMQSGNKLEAIRRLHTRLGIGLKEAKERVERGVFEG